MWGSYRSPPTPFFAASSSSSSVAGSSYSYGACTRDKKTGVGWGGGQVAAKFPQCLVVAGRVPFPFAAEERKTRTFFCSHIVAEKETLWQNGMNGVRRNLDKFESPTTAFHVLRQEQLKQFQDQIFLLRHKKSIVERKRESPIRGSRSQETREQDSSPSKGPRSLE